MNTACIVIPTFHGPDRLRYMLGTIERNDPYLPILIVEDPCGDADIAKSYDELELDYPVEVHHLSEWSNMHGAAMKAFEIAFSQYNPDWVIYLGDDLAITKGSLSNLVHFITHNDLNTVALVQPPYWNAGDIARATSENEECVFWSRERDFYASMDWTDKVVPNPHWESGIARPYVNVNGAAFACHSDTYRQVGGFAEGTWCLDESISYRTWMKSDKGIVSIPGPPLVHYCGGSWFPGAPLHDLHTTERWTEAIGFTKAECDFQMRCVMASREKTVMDEMRKASYWVQFREMESLTEEEFAARGFTVNPNWSARYEKH